MTDNIIPSETKIPRYERGRGFAEFVVRTLLRRMGHGAILLNDGQRSRRYGPGTEAVSVTVTDSRAYVALLRDGAAGFGQSYVAGWWECDDLTNLVRTLIQNLAKPLGVLDRVARVLAPLTDRLPARNARKPDDDRRFIRAHYDLGNDFYRLMLDDTMLYSCAYFETPETSLRDASIAKMDRLAHLLELGPDDHLVEIGTGWGGLACHMASTYGCRVTTTTISDAQYEEARRRVAEARLEDRVTVLNRDYRELEGTFDKLISVEMIEAIGWRNLPTFFRTCDRLLKPGGRMALQAITIDDRAYDRAKNRTDFIKDMIFPGGFLPSLESLVRTSSRVSELRVQEVSDMGLHYAETLSRWRDNLAHNDDAVRAFGYGEAFHRMWQMYLAYCEAAFLEQHISDVQILFTRRAGATSQTS